MLPRQNRVLTAAEFRQGFRSPDRYSTGWASFYLVPLPHEAPTRVGFVVSGAVGNAVTRNRIKRRLRAVAVDFLSQHPLGYQLTLRVRREAVDFEFQTIAAEFQSATKTLISRFDRS